MIRNSETFLWKQNNFSSNSSQHIKANDDNSEKKMRYTCSCRVHRDLQLESSYSYNFCLFGFNLAARILHAFSVHSLEWIVGETKLSFSMK